MDRQHYLYLITETYFDTKNPVASEPAEPMFDLQMKLCRQILIRKQKVAEREDFITKDEFFLQCELALDQLKEYVFFKCNEELSSMNNFQNYSDGVNYDNVYNVWDLANWDRLKKQAKNDFDNFDIDAFLVDLRELNPIIYGKLCNYDIEFLEEIIKNFDTEIEQEPEPAPLDLSDTSAVEKIIYLSELGIIDFLRTKTKTGISNGSLASVLSGITGVKADTLKSSLNRIPKDHKIDNKHPYYTTKTVDKIKTFLIKLGF